jgi:hypothetical protein
VWIIFFANYNFFLIKFFQFLILIATLIVLINARGYQSPVNRGRAKARSGAYRSPVAAASSRSSSYSSISSSSSSSGYARPIRQAQQQEEPRPEPYSFTFDTTDEYGTVLTRTESGDANGVVTGSYMYRDAEGLYRTVEYTDDGSGFRAVVNTNEPGVISHKPADAEYIKQ